jgi:formate dehydrogenase maturation protein FdhE
MSYLFHDDCMECYGEGYIKFISHDTGEYREYEKEQCPECERLISIDEKKADQRHRAGDDLNQIASDKKLEGGF